jgi:hypothetical protein
LEGTDRLAELAHRRTSVFFRVWIPPVEFFRDLIPYDQAYASRVTFEALRLLEEDKKQYARKGDAWLGMKLSNRITLAFAEAYALYAEGASHTWKTCICDACFMSHELLRRVFGDPLDAFQNSLYLC